MVRTDFARIMLDSFWYRYKFKLLKAVFLPKVISLGFTTYYMINVVCTDTLDLEKWQKFVGTLLIFYLVYHIIRET